MGLTAGVILQAMKDLGEPIERSVPAFVFLVLESSFYLEELELEINPLLWLLSYEHTRSASNPASVGPCKFLNQVFDGGKEND